MVSLNKGGEAANMGMTRKGYDKYGKRRQITNVKPTPHKLDREHRKPQPRSADVPLGPDSSKVRTNKDVGI